MEALAYGAIALVVLVMVATVWSALSSSISNKADSLEVVSSIGLMKAKAKRARYTEKISEEFADVDIVSPKDINKMFDKGRKASE